MERCFVTLSHLLVFNYFYHSLQDAALHFFVSRWPSNGSFTRANARETRFGED